MDAKKMLLQTDLIKLSGDYSCIEEYTKLKNSLIILQNENHFEDIFLWGKIIGTENNYYISYGYEVDCLNGKVFYYSIDGVNWRLMPASSTDIQSSLKFCKTQFVGDPSFLSEAKIDADLNSDSTETIQMIKEEDRLSATISLIDEEAVILPRGALFKHTNGIVTLNEHFHGLNKEESKHLYSYVHYRIPKQKWNTNLLTRVDYSYEMDFMDTIDLDIPKSCWSLHYEEGGKIVILRNLFWIGMTFIHCLDTPEYFFSYIGNGKKNIDVPFML